MQVNVLWTGVVYHSLENCLITAGEQGAEITSTIVGMHEGVIYKVDYHIKTNPAWETIYCKLNTRLGDVWQEVVFKSDGKGHWLQDGVAVARFAGCTEVDISLTPFTNTLAVNRLNLPDGADREIKVVYLDVLANDFRAAIQKYTRLSATQYKYENVPNDFEAEITVDEAGLVVNYPELFIRSAKLPSHYAAGALHQAAGS